jgi:3-deoxy-D-manno-octulosonic-acid transferase
MGHVSARAQGKSAILIHAVSLGEMNATRGLVEILRTLRPELHIIISTTTETGLARAQQLYRDKSLFTIIRYPLDFTPAIARVLDNLRPELVALMELEVWPNFLRQCEKRRIPVVLLNGRVTESSFRKYRLARPIVRKMFFRLAAVCAQDQIYADRFAILGTPAARIQVTGTMKFDSAVIADQIAGDRELAASLRLSSSDRIWACGSTGPGEEELVLTAYSELLAKHNPSLRLIIVPRKPERFDEVAALIQQTGFPVIRRSRLPSDPEWDQLRASRKPAVILGDTMGELTKFYSLADVVFVGRTLVDLGPRQHGSDMIEPAALAKPVIVGPFTTNFAEVMNRFRAAGAMVEIAGANELAKSVAELLASPQKAREMARRAQQVVSTERGATERHAQIILKYLV